MGHTSIGQWMRGSGKIDARSFLFFSHSCTKLFCFPVHFHGAFCSMIGGFFFHFLPSDGWWGFPLQLVSVNSGVYIYNGVPLLSITIVTNYTCSSGFFPIFFFKGIGSYGLGNLPKHSHFVFPVSDTLCF